MKENLMFLLQIIILFCLGYVVGLVVGELLWGSLARAHDAPSGWSYDLSCCNTNDCRQVNSLGDTSSPSKVFVREVTGGYSVEKPNGTSEFVAWNAPRIRQSQDEHFHWCSYMMGSDTTQTICLYVPSRGY